MNIESDRSHLRTAVDITISLSLIFIVIAWCLIILMPFISLIVWGGVIAIAGYKPFLKLRGALGGNQKLAVVLFAAFGLAVVLVPAWMFAESIVETAMDISSSLETGEIEIKPPSDNVKDWPLVGNQLYASWSEAATNMEGWLRQHREAVRTAISGTLSKLLGISLSVLQFIISILIAAVLLGNADAIGQRLRRLFMRIVGPQADDMMVLSAATVRSVAVGVMGIAFIQAFLGGLGMLVVGVPAAGVWALFILILAIAQLPPLVVLLPAIIYVFSVESTTVALVFMVWSVAVSFSDAVLKPLLLGRGVEAPMLVILLGAIGGMIHSGILGLFVGAVILALGYTLLQAWLESGSGGSDETVESS